MTLATIEQTHPSYEHFKRDSEWGTYFAAGFPSYFHIFLRDKAIAFILAHNYEIADSVLRIGSKLQGKQFDPITGEEPGKEPHQLPGVPINERTLDGKPADKGGKLLLTTYNACDTTSLYQIVAEARGRKNAAAVEEYKPNIVAGVDYTLRHVLGDTFVEFPPSGADRFALRVTQWKDSILPCPNGKEEPEYPVSYAIAHFMAARGLLASSRILKDGKLARKADAMFKAGIADFITRQGFVPVRDKTTTWMQPSSDELHSLAYIPPEYRKYLPLKQISERAKALHTEAGIACTPQEIAEKIADPYHAFMVWIFENALIHYGASKFNLEDEAKVTERCVPHINKGTEQLKVHPKIEPSGNPEQLFSVAGGVYFNGSTLRNDPWL